MVDKEIMTDVIEADRCLNEAQELLTQKKYSAAKDKVKEARDLLKEIVEEDEQDETDVELERSKAARKSITMPYSEKF